MNKLKILFPILFLFLTTTYSQNIEIPQLALTGISFDVSIDSIPDSIKTVEIVILGGTQPHVYNWDVIEGKISEKLSIDVSQNYEIKNNLLLMCLRMLF